MAEHGAACRMSTTRAVGLAIELGHYYCLNLEMPNAAELFSAVVSLRNTIKLTRPTMLSCRRRPSQGCRHVDKPLEYQGQSVGSKICSKELKQPVASSHIHIR
jgi:hypothetical protein